MNRNEWTVSFGTDGRLGQNMQHAGDPHYQTGIHRGEDMYEVGGFIVHFFSRGKVELLAEGYKILSVDKFEEGRLPRKLFRVTLRKK